MVLIIISGKKSKVLKLNYVSGREEHSLLLRLKKSLGFICNICIKSEQPCRSWGMTLRLAAQAAAP